MGKQDMPTRFRAVLASDPAAAAAFTELTPSEKREYIERAHDCAGKRDMEELARELRSHI